MESARAVAQASSERFRALFHHSPNPSSVTTLEGGRCLAVNGAWARAMGFAPAEMIGRSALEIGIWPDAAERERFVASLRQFGALQRFPVRFRTRKGEIRQMRIGAELIDWEGERAILSSMHDVTEIESARRRSGSRRCRWAPGWTARSATGSSPASAPALPTAISRCA